MKKAQHKNPADYVVIGDITKPHGIRGDICLKTTVESFETLACAETLSVRCGSGSLMPIRLVSWRWHKNTILLSLKESTDRTTAETFRGCEVLVHEADLPELSDNELYLHSIPGLTVYLEDNTLLGVITDILTPAGQEIWVIDASHSGQEVLFPVAQEFIRSINPEEKSVIIAPPPGLVELYLQKS